MGDTARVRGDAPEVSTERDTPDTVMSDSDVDVTFMFVLVAVVRDRGEKECNGVQRGVNYIYVYNPRVKCRSMSLRCT